MSNPTSVTASIALTVTQPARLVFSCAVAQGTPTDRETLSITVDGTEVPATEVSSIAGTRLHVVDAPTGRLELAYAADVTGSAPTPAVTDAEAIEYTRPSRYCESDRFNVLAPTQFAGLAGQELVTAVGAWVNGHMRYIPGFSGSTDSAIDTLLAGQGVCRDFAHLAITFCRCMNIPARYCTGYLGDIGMPPPYGTMDFAAWFEAYLGGQWWTFDARHNVPRVGRVLMARGRDAADVAIATVFGWHRLDRFDVVTEETPAP